MIQKTINLYSIDELHNNALSNAIIEMHKIFDYDNSENENTLAKFCEIFNVQVTNWQFDEWNYHYSFEVENNSHDYELSEISGLHLIRYIQNHIKPYIIQGKYYSTHGRIENGKYTYKHRHSKVIFQGFESCPLTGYYIDHDILKPVFDYLQKPDMNKTYYSLMSDCLNAFYETCKSDYKGFYEEDHMKELAEANEFYFTEDGIIH